MRKLLWLLLFPTLASASTVTIQLNNLSTTPAQATASSVRVDLQNCPAPRIPGTGFLNQKTWSFSPNSAGLVTATLYQSSLISCGAANNSYYTFNFVSNGTVTSLGSYLIPAGTSDLSTLTPIYTAPTVPPPTGDSTYLRLDLGNFGNLTQPIPPLAAQTLTAESSITSQTALFTQMEQSAIDNGVINPTLYPGSDLSQQITNAIATACPNTAPGIFGAGCTIKVPPGSYTVTSGETFIQAPGVDFSLILDGAYIMYSGANVRAGIEFAPGTTHLFMHGGFIDLGNAPNAVSGLVLGRGIQGIWITDFRERGVTRGDGLLNLGANVVTVFDSTFTGNLIGVHLLGSPGYASNNNKFIGNIITGNLRQGIVDGDISQYPVGWPAGNGSTFTTPGTSSPNFNNYFLGNDLEQNGSTGSTGVPYGAVLSALTVGDVVEGSYFEATPYNAITLGENAGGYTGTDAAYTFMYGPNTLGPNGGTANGTQILNNYFTTGGGKEIIMVAAYRPTVTGNSDQQVVMNACFISAQVAVGGFYNNNAFAATSQFCQGDTAESPAVFSAFIGPSTSDLNLATQGDRVNFNSPAAVPNFKQFIAFYTGGPPVPLNPNNVGTNPHCDPAYSPGTEVMDTCTTGASGCAIGGGVTWQCVSDDRLTSAQATAYGVSMSDGHSTWIAK